jgi:integrase
MTQPRRRARDSGSVYLDKDAGRWVAAVTTYDPDTGQRHRRKMKAGSREDATRLRDQMLSERRDTGTVSARDYTVSHTLADLLRYPPASWKAPSTAAVNRMHADRLTAALGSVPLARLTARRVESHLRAEITRPRRPLAANTVRDELGLLKAAIRRAQRDQLIGYSNALLARVPAGAAERRSRSMTIAQVNQLLNSDMPPLWRAWVTVGSMLGLRPGELGGLSWDDVDLAAGVLRVRHSLKPTAAGLVPEDLKTDRSKRTLEMPAAVIDALVSWNAEQGAQQQAAGPAWCSTHNLVFTDGFGRPLNRQKVHYGFRKVCRAAGIGLWQPRELRHTFVSVLSDAGTDIEVIADAVGHVNSHVTRTVYRHQSADRIQATATVMDRVYGAGTGSG